MEKAVDQMDNFPPKLIWVGYSTVVNILVLY